MSVSLLLLPAHRGLIISHVVNQSLTSLRRIRHGLGHRHVCCICILLSIFLKYVLRDLHEIIQSLLIQLLCEVAYNALRVITIDSDSQSELKNDQEAFHVDEGCLID